MRQTKILLLSVSAGAGHTRAAEAIGAAANGRIGVQAIHLDVMRYAPASFRKLHTDFYIRLLNTHPAIWGQMYQITHESTPRSSTQRLRRAIEHATMRGLLTAIDQACPDAIVCTHFLPAEILSDALTKGRLHCPVWVQVTDFGLHRMWILEQMTGYFAPCPEVAFRIAAAGVPWQHIHVTGIPVMPGFAQVCERRRCALELGLDAARPTVLLMGGGAGLGRLDGLASRLLAWREDLQLIGVAGSNNKVLAALHGLAMRHPGRLLALGFTQQVERLMACADVVITKPGGLTTSECLAMGLPMLLNMAIPGPEERNADYLLEQGVALKAADALGLQFRLGELLAHPQQLALMRGRAKALGRPGAAAAVLETVLAALQQPLRSTA